MKILILSNEVWNDEINGNNVISNWFEGMNAEFANIYCSPGEPKNNCCEKYFQLTDRMMLKSIITSKRAGKALEYKKYEIINKAESEPKKLYAFLKSISGDWLRLIRELLWTWGKYDIENLESFINDFKPDVIFSERMASCKMLKLEKTIVNMVKTPIIAFTGDDEYSLRQFNLSPFFWINRFMIRRRLEEMVKYYKIYYSLSQEQVDDYKKRFHCNMKILRKCGEFSGKETEQKDINNPIRMVYAGKLYYKRWKALKEIAECLKSINVSQKKAILEIYTKDHITHRQRKFLDDGKNTIFKGGITEKELKEVYSKSDIVLHVEARDLKNRLTTRLSFSTKIIDCIFSGCAILAYCWENQSGWKYLKNNDSAICVSSKNELYEKLKEMSNNPEIIKEYARKAYNCGWNNHRKEIVQENILSDFKKIVDMEERKK